MPTLERAEVSCGAQLLYDLYAFDNEIALSERLRSRYMSWGRRAVEAGAHGYIYKGETIIFSDNDANGRGRRLASIIRKHDLGKVVKLSTKNPNTKHNITTYLWCYNGKKIKVTK